MLAYVGPRSNTNVTGKINKGTNTVSSQECEKNIVLGLKDTLLYLNKKCGYSINGGLDVGANDGNWSLDLRGFIRAEFETDPSFYLVEGSDAHAESLRSTGIPYHIGLVADVEKVVTFIKRDGSTGNTTIPEKRDEEGVPGEFLVKQKALSVDQIVKNAKAGPFNFMKLDVQGAETLYWLERNIENGRRDSDGGLYSKLQHRWY